MFEFIKKTVVLSLKYTTHNIYIYIYFFFFFFFFFFFLVFFPDAQLPDLSFSVVYLLYEKTAGTFLKPLMSVRGFCQATYYLSMLNKTSRCC